jgi:hypothetical protein
VGALGSASRLSDDCTALGGRLGLLSLDILSDDCTALGGRLGLLSLDMVAS